MNPRHLRTACVAALALSLSACDASDSECGEPLYAGKATDEAWRAMVDARTKAPDASRAVTLLSPSEGEAYTANATPPRWEWTSPLHSSLQRSAPGALALAAPRAPRSFTAWLGELLVPTAHAHLPPYTGELYWVEVSTPGAKCPVAQVLTSELFWQLDATSWAELGKNAGDLRVQVTSAYLKDNRVTEGPFQLATPRTFRRGAP
ncbi:hypothetical protein [Archangium sp.]|jgi:hypothetical protein|uniref:hypothetical protein n=1 Tax=Archangium sp. TaxID=1872627 RepID=UPI002EDA5EDE